MKFKQNISGEFKFVKSKNGVIIHESPWIKNMILDNAFVKMSNMGSIVKYCHVGTGDSEPIASQLSLDSQTSRKSFISENSSAFTLNNDTILTSTYKFTFKHTDSSKISEIGLSPSQNSNDLTTRSLIKNSNGESFSIDIATGETVDIFYRLWVVYENSPEMVCRKIGMALGAEYNSSGKRKVILSSGIGSVTTLPVDNIFSGHVKYLDNNGLKKFVIERNELTRPGIAQNLKSITVFTEYGIFTKILDIPMVVPLSEDFKIKFSLDINFGRYTGDFSTIRENLNI